jgi:hypothetical protein
MIVNIGLFVLLYVYEVEGINPPDYCYAKVAMISERCRIALQSSGHVQDTFLVVVIKYDYSRLTRPGLSIAVQNLVLDHNTMLSLQEHCITLFTHEQHEQAHPVQSLHFS